MTLDDIEKLSIATVSAAENFREDSMLRRKLESNADTKLARAVLAMLPVVRLAEKYAAADLVAPDMKAAVDALRAALEKP